MLLHNKNERPNLEIENLIRNLIRNTISFVEKEGGGSMLAMAIVVTSQTKTLRLLYFRIYNHIALLVAEY